MKYLKKELNIDFIKWLANKKKENKNMLDFRIKSFFKFQELKNPSFGPKINIDFNKLNMYNSVINGTKSTWNDIPCNITNIFKNLGVIDAENNYLDGVSNQYESEVIYHKNNTDKDIIFMSTDDALKKHPKLFKKYFNNIVKYDENKYTALNGALWSGGSFIYIPPHTHLDRPLQSYFRIDSSSLGQFERTIIIVDDYSSLDYIEGCTARSHSKTSLHAGVVEIYVGKHAKCRYTAIQNWSKDIYNIVTKKAIVDDFGIMEWIDGNVGSGLTMNYPCCILKGNNSKGNSLSIAYAKKKQYLDTGAKMIHLGRNTKSNIISKSIAKNTGISDYRGKVLIKKMAKNSSSKIKCDTLILDQYSSSDTYPQNIIENNSSTIEHEATISKISEEKLNYLMSKGLSEDECKQLLVLGFISDFKKELPMVYAIELNRLIKE